jgi:hypothetical protein
MSEALLTDLRFHRLLLAFDEDLAARARAGRCRRCGGVLHSARYRRKPRGLPAGLGEEYRQRTSDSNASSCQLGSQVNASKSGRWISVYTPFTVKGLPPIPMPRMSRGNDSAYGHPSSLG